jgi:hypothetical protein
MERPEDRSKYLWRLEGVVCREVDGEEENPSGVWTVALKHTVSSLHNIENDNPLITECGEG